MKRALGVSGALPIVALSVGFAWDRGATFCRPVARWFRRGLPLAVEIFMFFVSARMALTLAMPPAYFLRFPEQYAWLVRHGPPASSEWVWAFMGAGSALLKGIGIAVCLAYRRDTVMLDLGYGIRLFGWLLSCVLWGSLTISVTVWDPFSGAAAAYAFAFAVATWGLCMGAAMPDDSDGRN